MRTVHDKRKHRRIRKRLRVNYGERDLSRTGITADVSEGGMFILTNSLEPLDTRLHMQLHVDARTTVFFETVVAWHRNVPPELRSSSAEGRGFGVRFLSPSEVVASLLPRPEGPLTVRYATREALYRAYQAELRMGGVFIPTERALQRDAQVSVAFELEFIQQRLEFPATVLHVSGAQSSGVKGVAVAFREPAVVSQSFLPLLALPQRT